MPACPNGHQSAATDYCDVCGDLMTAAPPSAPATATATEDKPAADSCPVCRTERTGRFCEDCGYDYDTGNRGSQFTAPLLQPAAPSHPAHPAHPGHPGQPVAAPARPAVSTPLYRPMPHQGPPPAGWSAVVIADRRQFERVLAEMGPDAGSLKFPPYAPERRYLLVGPQVRIGRRSVSRGVTPEIDLSTPPADPGVSHIHAVLLSKPDGTWVLVDPGSTNRTTINDSADPIEYNVEVPLHDGDRIHVGAWTTITLRKE